MWVRTGSISAKTNIVSMRNKKKRVEQKCLLSHVMKSSVCSITD